MLNEFRQDLVSGEWVLFATGRAKRPQLVETAAPAAAGAACPFDDPVASGQEIVSASADGWVTVIKNKFPAVTPGVCTPPTALGPFAVAAANGFHEVAITRDHQRNFQDFTTKETAAVLKTFRERYLAIAQYDCGDYIQIFNNTGPQAGASLVHPHSQILSTPIIPPTVARSLQGAARYWQAHQQRVHETLLRWEQSENQRIIFANADFVALCPYVSARPYEIKIFPAKPGAHFAQASDDDLVTGAEALNTSLHKLAKVIPNLQYNFFIHTAPVRGESEPGSSQFYHWHIEIVPYFSILAGFDFSTGITVNVIDPDQAAAELRAA